MSDFDIVLTPLPVLLIEVGIVLLLVLYAYYCGYKPGVSE